MSKVTDAFHDHHQAIVRGLRERATAFENDHSLANGQAIVEFLKSDLLPHAFGEERFLYPLIARLLRAHGDPTATMVVDHEFLQSYVNQIEEAVRALTGQVAAERAAVGAKIHHLISELTTLLHVHLEKEERIYMPLLARYASLRQQQTTLARMHRAHHERAVATQESEQSEDVELSLDVRYVAPVDRHPLIFKTFAGLKPGEAFVLVNDHDPKPLYYQFEAEQPNQFSWNYLEQGPQVWRVQIGRLAPKPQSRGPEDGC